MEKFADYKYQRPDMTKLTATLEALLQDFENATTLEEQDRIMEAINQERNQFETMAVLVNVRHTIDTTDAFYEEEKNFFNQANPVYQELISRYYKKILASPLRGALEEKWGKQVFRIAEMSTKIISDAVLEDLAKENQLASEYTKLSSSAKILFEGEERNLSQMTPFTQSIDRETRLAAQKAVTGFFEENEATFDRIYDDMVQIRTEIARKLGFKNYVELGYARLNRSDYNAEMAANYRKQVYENLVPASVKLRERQMKRLGLDKLYYYDSPLQFLSGNPTPKGEEAFLVDTAEQMYRELSPETGEFFQFMKDHALLDLTAKKGKAGGGYCTFVANYKAPFIFSNFNGTSHDVDVLTHEAGHAFQVYQSRNYQLPEYVWPTLEACEIHSMSMEFFAWPWMELFFKEDMPKYKFTHIESAVNFIPYGVTVDEFQHWVYENPEATPKERKSKWRETEKKYLPMIDYKDNDFLERGGFWFRQGHIFKNPFYYIDYTLAQVCALQFWVKNQENHQEAWGDYLRLCQAGGSKSFLELVELANLKNPFVDGTIASVMPQVDAYLESVEDSKF